MCLVAAPDSSLLLCHVFFFFSFKIIYFLQVTLFFPFFLYKLLSLLPLSLFYNNVIQIMNLSSSYLPPSSSFLCLCPLASTVLLIHTNFFIQITNHKGKTYYLLHYNLLFDQPQQSPNGVTPVFSLFPTCTNWCEAFNFLYILRYHTIKSELIGVQGR